MFVVKKTARLFAFVVLSIVRLVALAILALGVTMLALITIFQVVYLVQNWSRFTWLESVLNLVMAITVVIGFLLTILKFFEDRPWAARARAILKLPIAGMLWLFALLVPYLVLIGFLTVILVAWWLLLSNQILPPFNENASQFVVLALTALAFTQLGERACRLVIRWTGAPWRFDWLFHLLQPSIARVYIYALLALAYAAAKLEGFSEMALIHWSWWQGFKEVVVEMLLTYVAFDAAFTAWRDHRIANQGRSFWQLVFPKPGAK